MNKYKNDQFGHTKLVIFLCFFHSSGFIVGKCFYRAMEALIFLTFWWGIFAVYFTFYFKLSHNPTGI